MKAFLTTDSFLPLTKIRGGELPLSNNALSITTDYTWNGLIARVDNANSRNMPTGVTHAIKYILQYNTQNVLVILLELYPVLGRVWINKYTTTANKWSGWVTHAPQ